VQAAGACTIVVVCRAMIRDTCEGADAIRMMSHFALSLGVGVSIAPLCGGFLTTWFGWRATFLANGLASLIIVAGLAVAAILYFLVARTRLGMLIRAGASNRTMVEALGININRLFLIVFALGAAMAGLAGMLIAPITEASIGMGNDIIIVAFVVVIVGGIGSVKGAFCAALILGLIDTLSRSYLDALLKLAMPVTYAETAAPALSAMLIYILMAAVLAFRPQGLFPPAGMK